MRWKTFNTEGNTPEGEEYYEVKNSRIHKGKTIHEDEDEIPEKETDVTVTRNTRSS